MDLELEVYLGPRNAGFCKGMDVPACQPALSVSADKRKTPADKAGVFRLIS
jgi:hypothetical protein